MHQLTHFIHIATVLFLFVCTTVHSAENPTPDNSLPKRLSISTGTHPAVVEHFQPWVKQAYAELGIEIEFLTLNEERSLVLLQNGEIDGDIIRSEQIIAQLQELYPVFLLGEAQVYLVCRPRVECNDSTFYNSKLILGFVAGNNYLQELLLGTEIAQMRYTSYQLLQKSYQQKRVDAYVEIRNPYEAGKSFPKSAGIFNLGQVRGFHVLHKKHRHLIPLVAEKLQELSTARPCTQKQNEPE